MREAQKAAARPPKKPKVSTSELMSSRWQDPEQRIFFEEHNRSIAQKGADAVKERWNSDPVFRAEQIAKRTGRKRTADQCEAIRRARTGLKLTEAVKAERKAKMIANGTWRGKI